MAEKHDITLTGIGVPVEVLYNPELTQTDKILFGIIQNLSKRSKGCTASNKYLADLIFSKEQTVSNSIQTLRKYKYIIVDSKNGIYRSIFINPQREEIYKELVFIVNEYIINPDEEPLYEKLYRAIKKII